MSVKFRRSSNLTGNLRAEGGGGIPRSTMSVGAVPVMATSAHTAHLKPGFILVVMKHTSLQPSVFSNIIGSVWKSPHIAS